MPLAADPDGCMLQMLCSNPQTKCESKPFMCATDRVSVVSPAKCVLVHHNKPYALVISLRLATMACELRRRTTSRMTAPMATTRWCSWWARTAARRRSASRARSCTSGEPTHTCISPNHRLMHQTTCQNLRPWVDTLLTLSSDNGAVCHPMLELAMPDRVFSACQHYVSGPAGR